MKLTFVAFAILGASVAFGESDPVCARQQTMMITGIQCLRSPFFHPAHTGARDLKSSAMAKASAEASASGGGWASALAQAIAAASGGDASASASVILFPRDYYIRYPSSLEHCLLVIQKVPSRPLPSCL